MVRELPPPDTTAGLVRVQQSNGNFGGMTIRMEGSNLKVYSRTSTEAGAAFAYVLEMGSDVSLNEWISVKVEHLSVDGQVCYARIILVL